MCRMPREILVLAATILFTGVAPALAQNPTGTPAPAPQAGGPILVLDVEDRQEGQPGRQNRLTYALRQKFREYGFRCVSLRQTAWDQPGDFYDPQDAAYAGPPVAEASLYIQGTLDIRLDHTSEFYGGTVAYIYQAEWGFDLQNGTRQSLGRVEDRMTRGSPTQNEALSRATALAVRYLTAALLQADPLARLVPEPSRGAVAEFCQRMEAERAQGEH